MPVDQLGEADLPKLQALARSCLEADGGLPQLAEPGLLRARLLCDQTLAIREDGRLLAAAGLSVTAGGATTSGLVAPAARGRGLGTHLMAWAEDAAGPAPLTVLTETCGSDAERLYARHGMVRTFAETVMRHDLTGLPSVGPPPAVRVVSVIEADRDDLYAAYLGSFADRPGFTAPDQAQWVGELADDEDWRRELSLLALRDGTPIGFLNVVGRSVDQVGVVPPWRGRRLGAHLVARALRSLALEADDPVWLCVNVDNPAADLYRRLGFTAYGTRARYARPRPTRA